MKQREKKGEREREREKERERERVSELEFAWELIGEIFLNAFVMIQ